MLKYIRKRILKYKEKQIKDDFRTLKIEIQNYELLKPSVWKRIFKCLKKLYEMYPEIKLGMLDLIKVQKSFQRNNQIAITSFYFEKFELVDITRLGILINANFFNDVKTFADVKSSTYINISLNDFVEWVISHEFGHVLDIHYSILLEKLNKCRFVEIKTAEKILNNLIFSNEIIKTIQEDKTFNAREMSRYATKNHSETFAEAIAFGYFNSDNESSKKVLEEFQKRRERK